MLSIIKHDLAWFEILPYLVILSEACRFASRNPQALSKDPYPHVTAKKKAALSGRVEFR